MAKATVAVLRVRPESILEDIDRLCGLGGLSSALAPGATTILKTNISWHFPFPGANTTPWQLEGTALALKRRGFGALACVENETVVTRASKGQVLNHHLPVLRRLGIPALYNFRSEDMRWIVYRPRARMRALERIFPDGIRVPDYFIG